MSERILVVDDDDRIAAIVRDGLSRMGYRVELAADGPAALAAVRAKPFVLEELVARVRAVLRRHAPRSAVPLRVADLRLDAQGRRAWRGDRALELSAREFDLLECLMQHAGQVLTHGELLEQVWGSDFEGESNAVKVYVAHLRQKLSAAGEPDLLYAVRGVGYVLREQGGVS